MRPTLGASSTSLRLGRAVGPYRDPRRIGHGSSGRSSSPSRTSRSAGASRSRSSRRPRSARSSPARFDVERRALERAEHPNIARILDAGARRAASPSSSMEYVEGPPITAYCDREPPPAARAHPPDARRRRRRPARAPVRRDPPRPEAREHPRRARAGARDPLRPRLRDREAVAGAFPEDDAADLRALPIGTPVVHGARADRAWLRSTRAPTCTRSARVPYELVAGRPPVDGSGDPRIDALQRIREERSPRAASRAALRYPRLSDRAPGSLLADLDAMLGKALEKPRDPATRPSRLRGGPAAPAPPRADRGARADVRLPRRAVRPAQPRARRGRLAGTRRARSSGSSGLERDSPREPGAAIFFFFFFFLIA